MEMLEGRCLCGGVRFRFSEPQVSAHCHCEFCRLAHGAGFVTWVVVKENDFTVSRGTLQLKWYASSEQSERGFCTECGSSMFFRTKLCPGEIHVTRANVVSPLDLKPKYHCFTDKKVDWIAIDDGVECLSSESKELSHYKKIPAPV